MNNMLKHYSRLIMGVIMFSLSIFLFTESQITFGILSLLVSLILVLFYFRNENMLAAFYYLRKSDFDNAYSFLLKIKEPEVVLLKGQQAYYYFLIGTCETKNSGVLKAEKHYKKALALGLGLDHDIAMAKLSLAAAAMGRHNKREAEQLLSEAKKADKTKALTEQIKMLQDQMMSVGQKVPMGMHHMAQKASSRRRF